MVEVMSMPIKARRLGRPRAIPQDLEPVVVELYDGGYGNQAIARILNTTEYGLNVHFSSVRKTLMRLGKVIGK